MTENMFYLQDKEYIGILEDFTKELENLIDKNGNDRYTDEAVKEDAKNAREHLIPRLEKYHADKTAEYNQKMNEIKQKYINEKASYDDPSTEILRRQDFDNKIKLTSNAELKDMLADENQNFSEYEINKIELEFRERGSELASYSDKQLLRGAKERNELAYGYHEDEEYQKLQAEAKSLFHIRPRLDKNRSNVTHIHFDDGESERPLTRSPLDIRSAEMNSFDVRKIDDLKKSIHYMKGKRKLTPPEKKAIEKHEKDGWKILE